MAQQLMLASFLRSQHWYGLTNTPGIQYPLLASCGTHTHLYSCVIHTNNNTNKEERARTLPNSFCKASIILIPKADDDTTNKPYEPVCLMSIDTESPKLLIKSRLRYGHILYLVAHAYKPSTWQEGTGRSLEYQPPGLHNERLSQKKAKNKTTTTTKKTPANQPSKHTSQARWFHIRDSRLVQYIQILKLTNHHKPPN